MFKVFNPIKNDYLILLTYFFVLVAGYFIGIGSNDFPSILATTKDVMSILLPLFGLIIALLGLNNWKKTERHKMVCKFANEIRESSENELKNLSIPFTELDFFIRKEQYFRNNDKYIEAKDNQKYVLESCIKVDKNIETLVEKYLEHYELIYTIDEKIKVNLLALQDLLKPIHKLKIGSDSTCVKDNTYLKRVEHTQKMITLHNNIRERLRIISAANF